MSTRRERGTALGGSIYPEVPRGSVYMGPEGSAPALPGQRRTKVTPSGRTARCDPGSVAVMGVGGRGGSLLDPAPGSQAMSVPTGGRGAGGGSWQGGAAGGQHDHAEGGAAWTEAQAPPGECHGVPPARTHACTRVPAHTL